MLGIPGIWWVDMQVDGVRRGSLAKHMNSLPQPGDIIAATFTSPLDALYLAAIFDPIFTASYPRTRKVLRLSLFGTYVQALRYPDETPPMPFQQYLTDLSSLARNNPHRIIVVFPECTTTNGKGILPFSPSLLSLPKNKRVFPLALRYAPADVTTPVSGARWTFLWNLLSSPTHTIRVRIASSTLKNTPARRGSLPTGSMMERDRASSPDSAATSSSDTLVEVGKDEEAMDREAAADQRFLDRLADDLARLQRVGRVGLTLSDKAAFVDSWTKYH